MVLGSVGFFENAKKKKGWIVFMFHNQTKTRGQVLGLVGLFQKAESATSSSVDYPIVGACLDHLVLY